ncbi:hypothetical protein AGMMS49983_10100 [Clostridia bacterium]|nr:hypothetical protein AGMMS49983_10100 [Clostridia bacterium]
MGQKTDVYVWTPQEMPQRFEALFKRLNRGLDPNYVSHSGPEESWLCRYAQCRLDTDGDHELFCGRVSRELKIFDYELGEGGDPIWGECTKIDCQDYFIFLDTEIIRCYIDAADDMTLYPQNFQELDVYTALPPEKRQLDALWPYGLCDIKGHDYGSDCTCRRCGRSEHDDLLAQGDICPVCGCKADIRTKKQGNDSEYDFSKLGGFISFSSPTIYQLTHVYPDGREIVVREQTGYYFRRK